MPPVSWGLCRIHRCWVVGDLGDGLCVDHWDGRRPGAGQRRTKPL